MRTLSSLAAATILLSTSLCGQSGPQYYRSAVHNGNRVKTVFGNWGVIGQPVDTRPRGAWIYATNGYIGDVSMFVGAEVKDSATSTKFHSVVTCPVARPALNRDESLLGDPWTFMPVNGYFNANKQSVAMSTDQTSWPVRWPDKMNDASDPGWSGYWNGYFGKRKSADQESYFVMDDNNDQRFNVGTNNSFGVSFKPDASNPDKNGLGLVVSVRGLQWSQFLAQDNIFWLYEITNTGTTTYDRVVFGMLVGTYVGCTGASDFKEYDDDWSFYDVKENITYTGDYPRDNSRNPFWVGPVGMVGYAFLESPGNPYDGIDNDGDVDKWVTASSNPFFEATDFDSVLIKAGDKIVLIDDNFNRKVITVPAGDTTVSTRGAKIFLSPGKTKLSEGGVVTISGNETVDPNAYDGIDNDLDGLIDENFYLHYRQIKKTNDVPPKTLIDILRPVRHKNFKVSTVSDPYSMIDERRDDLVDNDKDWDANYDDVGRDGIADPRNPDAGEKDGLPTSGYLPNGMDTGLPGEPHIDKTDVDESDQIGLTSFQYFTPANDVPLGDDEKLWQRLSPGFFAVPKSIVNNKPERGEDGDFIYGSGYFPLVAKRTERFSLALVYGGGNSGSREDDIADLLKHKKTVQKIYDANYQFPIPPDPAPKLWAYAEDGKVRLYWDRKSEDAVDPVLRIKDFEGYKIYKATDSEFNDAFVVTDANGNKKGRKPTFQVDLKDTTSGYYRAPADIFQQAEGFTFYLGSNTGLVHDTIDTDVINGRTYYYVLVAYDKGDEVTGIFPSENNWQIDIDQFGRIRGTSPNVAIVTPGAKVAGYDPGAITSSISPVNSTATGSLSYRIIDQSKITGSTYEITFKDTRDSGRFAPVTTYYTVRDTSLYSELFTPNKVDTIPTSLGRSFLVQSSVVVKAQDGSVISSSKYLLNAEKGTVRARKLRDLQPDSTVMRKYSIAYQYYPVYQSPYINESPFTKETKDTDIFDGLQLAFKNYWSIYQIDSLSGFNTGNRSYSYTFSGEPVDVDGDGQPDLVPIAYPADYDIIFYNSKVAASDTFYGSPAIPVNFRLWNRTDSAFTKFLFDDFNDPVRGQDGVLSPNDKLYFFDKDTSGRYHYTWLMTFSTKPIYKSDTVFTFNDGDSMKIRTAKPFRKGDVYRFTTTKPAVNEAQASASLAGVRVVPNPYVVQTNREQPLAPGTFGRGQRRIEFQNVPLDAKISIFTSRGDHVRTLYQDGSMQNGTIVWDVKSKENLDVAYGVYFYIVESSAGQKTGKLAIIK